MEEDLTALDLAVKEALDLGEIEVQTYSPLVLAYIGDAVYELLIRTRVISRGSMQVNKMHRKSADLVKAATQAKLVRELMEELTEEEMTVYRRGRNAKSGSMAKHATMTDYRTATGFEALVGYLYLTSRHRRLLELVHDGLEKIGELEANAGGRQAGENDRDQGPDGTEPGKGIATKQNEETE